MVCVLEQVLRNTEHVLHEAIICICALFHKMANRDTTFMRSKLSVEVLPLVIVQLPAFQEMHLLQFFTASEDRWQIR